MPESRERITCQEVTELVTEYIEGTLGPHETALFEQHLNFCDGCDWYVDQMRTTIAAVGRIEEADVPRRRCATACSPRSATGGARDRLQVPARRRHRRVHALRLAAARRRARRVGRGADRRLPQRHPRLPGRATCRCGSGRELYEIELGRPRSSRSARRSSPSRGRLVRRIDAWDDDTRAAYARDCADRAHELRRGHARLGDGGRARGRRRPGLDRLHRRAHRRGARRARGLPRRARAPGRVAGRSGSACNGTPARQTGLRGGALLPGARRARDRLLRGRLAPEERERFDAHVADCPGCDDLPRADAHDARARPARAASSRAARRSPACSRRSATGSAAESQTGSGSVPPSSGGGSIRSRGGEGGIRTLGRG